MHRALNITEIVHRVLEFCYRHDIASVLRTCRLFEATARPLLWAVVPRLDILVLLIPGIEITWIRNEDRKVVRMLRYQRGYHADELGYGYNSDLVGGRFRLYSTCVRDLTIDGPQRNKSSGINIMTLDPLIIDDLFRSNLDALFPNLDAIRLWNPQYELEAISRYFCILKHFSKQVAELQFILPECTEMDGDEVEDVYKCLIPAGTKLQALKVSCYSRRTFTRHSVQFSRLIRSSENLVELASETPIQWKDITHIAQLSNLKFLRVKLAGKAESTSTWVSTSANWFPAIEEIRINWIANPHGLPITGHESVIALFKNISSQSLRVLYLYATLLGLDNRTEQHVWETGSFPSNMFEELSKLLPNCPYARSLTYMRYLWNCSSYRVLIATSEDSERVLDHIALPLSNLPALQCLFLPPSSFRISNAEQVRKYRKLLTHRMFFEMRIPMERAALRAFVDQLEAESLELPPNVGLLISSEDLGTVPDPIPRIRSLGVIRSEFELVGEPSLDKAEIALFLRELCPFLDRLVAMDTSPLRTRGEHFDLWGAVASSLKVRLFKKESRGYREMRTELVW